MSTIANAFITIIMQLSFDNLD